jgi:hypothetical protein
MRLFPMDKTRWRLAGDSNAGVLDVVQVVHSESQSVRLNIPNKPGHFVELFAGEVITSG